MFTAIKNSLLLSILYTTTVGAAIASESFFYPCESVINTKPFKQLKAYYENNPEVTAPESCFRLNDKEFLVTAPNQGRVLQGLYYYNANTGTFVFPDGAYRAGIQVIREFEGLNNKRFVILGTSNVHQGVWVVGYDLLYLTPRNNNHPFKIKSIFWTSQDPSSGMCGENILEGNAGNIRKIDIKNENTDKVSITFTMDSQSCPKGKIQIIQRDFLVEKILKNHQKNTS